MQIRTLDGDDPATIDLLLPGFRETMRQDLPDDPPVSAALLARLLQRRRGADRLILAAVDPDGVPAGYVKLGLDLGTGLDRAHGSLWVFPAYRGRGVGRALVAAARAELRERGRGILLVDAPHTPAAEAFAAAVGGRRVTTNLRNRLHLAGWAADHTGAPDPAALGVRLVRWTDRCPDDLVEQYARVWARTDAAVNGQAGAAGVTAADVRIAEQQALDSAHHQYAVAAVDTAGAGLLGYSTLFVRDSPMADSGQTMVLPEHRRRGLGTVLKTSLIDWARSENQHLALLQAWNAADNEAIRALNRRLGFRADQQWSTYRVAT
ncbi:GNAT family N-acetyltransferase [Micromonospora sp. AP08]|uniref:GNAT family N-acetyltransferase n=1 Tax=Micromonospora sp. AP08 TaxID=2604467 RepID=UPI0016521992|nr:GNAT family N-acetyltransferase [Micromonospora sp. AP08]